MVAVNVSIPREVKLKGLKEAPHSAIYRTKIGDEIIKKSRLKDATSNEL